MDISKLSPREQQVVELFGHGLDKHAIALVLNLSHSTIETHRERIIARLGMTGYKQFVQRAVEHQLDLRDVKIAYWKSKALKK